MVPSFQMFSVLIALTLLPNFGLFEIIEQLETPKGKPVNLDYPLDLAFIMDTTGSMGSYIRSAKENIEAIVNEIIKTSKSRVRLALIEYRDHPPQDRSFVTRVHDFTESVGEMKRWLESAKAQGGGDSPEAVADGLYNVTKLAWSAESTKIAVLISDAPPHALDPTAGNSFMNGCPEGHDPMQTVREIAKIGVTLYSVGVEPSINAYKEFFAAMAYITGGQYVPMRDPRQLINVIIGGAQEELSLKEFKTEVENEIEQVIDNGGVYDEDEIAQAVYQKLESRGAKSTHLVKNKKGLKGPNKLTLRLAKVSSMEQVRKKMEKKIKQRKSRLYSRRHMSSRAPDTRRYRKSRLERPEITSMHEHTEMDSFGLPGSLPMYSMALDEHEPRKSKSKMKKKKKESYSTEKSTVSLDQIHRLVKKLSFKRKGSP